MNGPEKQKQHIIEPWPGCVYEPVHQQLFRCVQSDAEHSQLFEENLDETVEDENIWVVYLNREYHDLSVSYSEKDTKILDIIERNPNMVRLNYNESYTPNDVVVGNARSTFEEEAVYDIRLQGDISTRCLDKECSCHDYLPDEKCPVCESLMKETISDSSGRDYCSVSCLNESETEKHVR